MFMVHLVKIIIMKIMIMIIFVFQVLAAMGAPIGSRSIDDQTPLHMAAMSGHLDCCKWLVANRCPLQAEDNMGRRAVDLAEQYQHRKTEDCLRACERGGVNHLRGGSHGVEQLDHLQHDVLPTIEEDGSYKNGGNWTDDREVRYAIYFFNHIFYHAFNEYSSLNPSNAEPTFVQSTRTQIFSKSILTLSCWYSLGGSH